MTSNYPPPNEPGMPGIGMPPSGTTTEQFGRPPGMGTVTSNQPPSADPLSVMRRPTRGPAPRRGWMTSEFGVFALVALGTLIASALVEGNADRADYFRADRAWFYVTILATAYIISRGLAKIGGRNDD